ncbi:MAG: hypothetical protein RR232_07155 [Clostridia bacterium]
MKKPFNKWNLLYVLLSLLILFSLFASPRIVMGVMNANKGQIVTVENEHE